MPLKKETFNSTKTFLYKDGFRIKFPTKVDMPLNKKKT